MRRTDFKVCVICNTFNQAEYITDALDGFCMQESAFPFVCCITDDASTDGERDVICDYFASHFSCDGSTLHYQKELPYGHLFFAQHQKNKNCYFSILLLKENHYKKGINKYVYLSKWLDMASYVAFCEGDDYWIDTKKLQRQIDWLDAHKDFSMCFSNAKVRNDRNYPLDFMDGIIENREYSADEFLQNWCVPTASVVIRRDVLDVPVIKPERILFGDIVISLKAEKCGRVMGFSDKMSVYRVNQGGVTQNQNYQRSSIMKRPEHIEFIIDNFGELLDRGWLESELCMRYCNRSLIQESIKDCLYDLFKAFSAKKWQTIHFVFYTYIVAPVKCHIQGCK